MGASAGHGGPAQAQGEKHWGDWGWGRPLAADRGRRAWLRAAECCAADLPADTALPPSISLTHNKGAISPPLLTRSFLSSSRTQAGTGEGRTGFPQKSAKRKSVLFKEGSTSALSAGRVHRTHVRNVDCDACYMCE